MPETFEPPGTPGPADAPGPPDPPEPRRFYVVWSPQGGPPVVRFPTFQAARSAAIRLSNKHAGQDFFVLQSCWGRVGMPAVEAEAIRQPALAVGPEATP
jgi:hypothetical protein